MGQQWPGSLPAKDEGSCAAIMRKSRAGFLNFATVFSTARPLFARLWPGLLKKNHKNYLDLDQVHGEALINQPGPTYKWRNSQKPQDLRNNLHLYFLFSWAS